MKGRLLLLGGAAALCAAVAASVAPPGAAATCTQAQKDARVAAANAYRKRMAPQRRAYFVRVTAPQKRTAFVKRQQAKLTTLRTAAACTVVTPLPPSSAASCDFELEPNREAVRNQPFLHSPMRNLGPLEPGAFIPALGRAEAVMVFVDFPGAPASESAAGLAGMYTAYLDWFQQASYGRFSVNVTVVPTWFRMPEPGGSYGPLQVAENADRYLADAVAAAGSAVDFSRYDSVWVVPSAESGVFGGSNYVRYPGRGVAANSAELRFGVLLSPSRRGAPFEAAHLNHRVLASLGTSDLGENSNKPLGHWDPNFADSQGARTAHLLGWHKWLLRWLDPAQITCLREPGVLEETLTPIARAGGKKLVVVPTGPSTAYALEVRRQLGYDRGICREGILLYTLDSQILSGNGPVEGKSAGTGCSPDVMPFAVGETYEDAGIKVEVLATDGSGYRVRVTKK
ncbi:MAG: hypothetical protein WD689_09600 [Gaiellaceae bacterium]